MFKFKHGFTVLELVISSVIVIIIFSFTLANFRSAQYGGELNSGLNQIVDGIKTVRTMAMGGQQLTNGSFPEGGYGFYINLNKPNQFVLFFSPNVGDNYIVGNEIGGGINKLGKVDFINLYGTLDSCLASNNGNFGPPGEDCWYDLNEVNGVSEINLVFNLSGEIFNNMSDIHYIGAKFKHQKTGREGYFYVSTKSGLVTGGFYE